MTPADKESYIEQLKSAFLNYFPLEVETLLSIEAMVQFQSLKKDEILLHSGEVAKNLHFIVKGAMRAYFGDEKGNTYNKNIFLEGSFAGSKVSMMLGQPSGFTLQALEETTIVSMNFKKYKALIAERPDFKDFYIAYLEKNWVIDKEEREISLVMDTATVRYLKLLQRHPGIDKRIPLQHIASHLGVTPIQLSRIRKTLKK
ncbi:Crp/Fnr family transcriptional regulator [Pedobacter africanus]|uniref:cAMP-binding domain of CRP or a regulatory subunit of cAMP-dependent protein kinases n=1 Tax=Pedobacter africanus TaxID=151894 RepID=A0A1W2E1U1_9SPHI|nr:Crp/Fnr family transcriptional regulator [Pedobacter africanus]SMD03206.1 cAMP-binding domain of CRP or a regulatory subunit of cAMP-dependent protein kinases [Pedobacter africanus]